MNDGEKQTSLDSDRRLWIVGGIACYYILFAVFLVTVNVNLMDMAGVWTTPETFFDMRVVIGGCESLRQGFNPLYFNPCDPGQRPLNYPRIWLLLEKTGINRSHTVFLGFSLAVIFYMAVVGLVIEKNPGIFSTVIWILALISPAVLLGVERGNNDLLIFVILAIAVTLLRQPRTEIRIIAYLVMFLAALLKLYPVLAVISSVREKPKLCLIIMIVFTAGFLIYAGVTYDDIATLMKTTEHNANISYGSKVIFGLIDQMMTGNMAGFPRWDDRLVVLFSWAAVVGVILLSFFYLMGKKSVSHYEGSHISSLRIGAGIYLGTFLAGQNWDYRLIFLLFVLPQLLEWKSSGHGGRIPVITIVLILLAMWSEIVVRWIQPAVLQDLTAIAGEMVNWALFGVLSFILVNTLPNWIRPVRLSGSK